MNTTIKNDFFTFVLRRLRLQRHDFWQVPAIVLAVFVIMQSFMLIVYAVSHNPETIQIGIAGLMGFVTAAMMNFVMASVRFCSEFRMGVHMSISRRRMLAGSAVLSLANAAENTLLAWGLCRLWSLIFGGTGIEDFMAFLPWWGWLACVYVPVAFGMLSGAIMLRFNKIGFWGLYAVFMVVCVGPQLMDKNASAESAFETLIQALPILLPAAAVLFTAAGIAMLWRVSVPE